MTGKIEHPKTVYITPPIKIGLIIYANSKSNKIVEDYLELLVLYAVCICMYGHTYSKIMDQPGKVASPARGQLNRKNEYFPVRVRA